MVCRLVCLSVTTVSPAKTAKPMEMSFGMWTGVGLRNHVLDGSPDPHTRLWGRKVAGSGHAGTCQVRGSIYSKRMIQQGAETVWCRCWLSVLGRGWSAHWCHLPNTTEPSACGSNTALCQITLTTCYHYHNCAGNLQYKQRHITSTRADNYTTRRDCFRCDTVYVQCSW